MMTMDDLTKRAGDPSAWDLKFLHAVRDLSMDDKMTIFEAAKDSGTYEALMSKLIEIERQEATLPSLEPDDATDLGETELFVREYKDKLRYSKSLGFLVYDGVKWVKDDLKARGLVQEFTGRQLSEAKRLLGYARRQLDRLTEAKHQDTSAARAAVSRFEKYRKLVLVMRNTSRIHAILSEAAPALAVDVEALDADGFLLNTPGGTVDLRTGQMKPHSPDDFCTKSTAVIPGDSGADLFKEFLRQLTSGDNELERYLQEVAGLSCIGVVMREELIIAVGTGGNGKSTFFNLLHRVLGEYAWTLSADVFTTSRQARNKSPELAELQGKRLVISSELEEGRRLDTAALKQMCSTDYILAEPKYRQPFQFKPTHHCVMYSNFLPRVSSNDAGTWSRLVIVPFLAKFRGQKNEVKNYADILLEECGGAVLSWMIEGAARVIENHFRVTFPSCVTQALEEYKGENDWLKSFLEDRCYIDATCTAEAGEMYEQYRSYCAVNGDFTRTRSEFKTALLSAGFTSKRSNTGVKYYGLRLKIRNQCRSVKYNT